MTERQGDGASLSIRVDLETGLRIGPGKIALLESIAETGSISAAGRALGMSYKRAWDLVSELNRGCGQRVVATSPGGAQGGGTSLTEAGHLLVRLYRDIERASSAAAAPQIRALNKATTGA